MNGCPSIRRRATRNEDPTFRLRLNTASFTPHARRACYHKAMRKVKPNMPRSPLETSAPDASEYEEERIPFDVVMRKLATTKPPHKAPKVPAKKPRKG